MNNLEWLYENDRETLLTMTAGDCDNCKFDNDCWNGSIYRCGRDWLEAEYVEPDSWKKIEADSMLTPEEYCIKHDYPNSAKYSAEKTKSVHLVARCKKLAGAQ